MKMLLHICCSPCLCFPFKFLSNEGWELKGFWYNPNIHPYTEYSKRLESVRRFSEKKGLEIIYHDEYDLEKFLQSVVFEEEEKCRICYRIRLSSAAERAKLENFEIFATTLLYSKFQKHDQVKEVGEEVAKKYGVKFYYRDFREGWEDGIKISKELSLYRQRYCGCLYSERDRFLRKR